MPNTSKEKKRTGSVLSRLYLAVAFLLVTALGTSMWATAPLAKYVYSDSDSDSARVAAFTFDVRDTSAHFIDVSAVNAPGKSKTIQFAVCNFNDSRVTEVAAEYRLSVEIMGSLPLQVEVTGDEGSITLTDSAREEQNALYSFLPAVKESDNYTLTVSWPENEKDAAYANGGISQVAIYISAWQVD